jgi:hypothetical protein
MNDNIQNAQKTSHERQNKRYVTFTYVNPTIRILTNIFKNTQIQIAFRPVNTIKW